MRCFVEPSELARDELDLPAEEAHHLVHVLRAREGQSIVLCDGAGGLADARLVRIERNRVKARVISRRETSRPYPQVSLFQGMVRGQKMDWIIQKSTELGASELRPVESSQAVARLPDARKTGRMERWRKIALNAARQCGAGWIPDIYPAESMASAIKDAGPYSLLLLCDPEEKSRHISQLFRPNAGGQISRIGVIIGPEGDFSPDEKETATRAGAVSVNLGPMTLRAETAALFVLSAIHYEFGCNSVH